MRLSTTTLAAASADSRAAVVMQELAAGARTIEGTREVQRGVFEPFERRRRVFAPSATTFVESGRVLSAVAAQEGWQVIDEHPSLLNDALIAASCREHHAHHERRRFQAPGAVSEGPALHRAVAVGSWRAPVTP